MPFHHYETGQDIRGKARIQPNHTGVIKEFDGLPLSDATWRSVVRMQAYPGTSLRTPQGSDTQKSGMVQVMPRGCYQAQRIGRRRGRDIVGEVWEPTRGQLWAGDL
jgi:hypothetical protein